MTDAPSSDWSLAATAQVPVQQGVRAEDPATQVVPRPVPPAPSIPAPAPAPAPRASRRANRTRRAPRLQTAGFRRTSPTSPSVGDRNLKWVGLTATTVGLCLVLFAGYVFVFSAFPQSRKQVALLAEFSTPSARASLTGAIPAEGSPVGVLQIPSLRLRQVVVQGTSATDLLEGPGVMAGTARPGTAGNSVIAGRRTVAGGPFAHLDKLAPGDRITITTGLGRFVYRVTMVGTAVTGSVDPISATHQARLTLVTSNPALLPTGRLYAVAVLQGKPATGPGTRPPRTNPTDAQRALSGDSSAVLPSVLWGAVLAIVLGASIWAYQRRRENVWAIYLLTTPIILAVALEWYSYLIRLLPATM